MSGLEESWYSQCSEQTSYADRNLTQQIFRTRFPDSKAKEDQEEQIMNCLLQASNESLEQNNINCVGCFCRLIKNPKDFETISSD